MAHVKNTTKTDVRFPNGPRVNVGEVVEVDDDTAASLVEQGWTLVGKKSAAKKAPAKKRAPRKAAAKKAAAPKTEAEPPADDTGTDGASDKEKP